MTEAADAERPISKSEFARRRGVTPGRVTQWISEGKITRTSLCGEGRDEKVIESAAVAELRAKLDIHQRLGNGVATRLNLDPPPPAPPQDTPQQAAPMAADNVIAFDAAQRPAPKPVAPTDEVGEAIRREQLESLQRKNRREAIEEAATSGQFADAIAVRQQMGRLAAQMVTAFEGALPELAAAIAAKWQLPQRDVLHLMRTAYRDVRAKQAAAARTDAEAVPPTIETQVAEELAPA